MKVLNERRVLRHQGYTRSLSSTTSQATVRSVIQETYLRTPWPQLGGKGGTTARLLHRSQEYFCLGLAPRPVLPQLRGADEGDREARLEYRLRSEGFVYAVKEYSTASFPAAGSKFFVTRGPVHSVRTRALLTADVVEAWANSTQRPLPSVFRDLPKADWREFWAREKAAPGR